MAKEEQARLERERRRQEALEAQAAARALQEREEAERLRQLQLEEQERQRQEQLRREEDARLAEQARLASLQMKDRDMQLEVDETETENEPSSPHAIRNPEFCSQNGEEGPEEELKEEQLPSGNDQTSDFTLGQFRRSRHERRDRTDFSEFSNEFSKEEEKELTIGTSLGKTDQTLVSEMVRIGLAEDGNSEVQPSQISARSIENQGKELDTRVSKTEEKQRPLASMAGVVGQPIFREVDLSETGSDETSSEESLEVVVTSPQTRRRSEEGDFETEGRRSPD